MALLPTIPTSFVPRETLASRPRARASLSGLFDIFAYAVLGIVFILALGVFFYGRILASTLEARETALAKAAAAIDPATVEGFVRLRDRLNASQSLLKNHVAVSNFFASLGELLPSNVRFSSLHVLIDSTGRARVEGSGVAKSFNALAAASGAFASDGRIKDVIFSKISILPDSSVSFGFSATLDPKLIVFSPNDSFSTSL